MTQNEDEIKKLEDEIEVLAEKERLNMSQLNRNARIDDLLNQITAEKKALQKQLSELKGDK